MITNGVDIQQLLNDFMLEQCSLLQSDASEQAIAHQLAIKFSQNFLGWDIDCEYNRSMDTVKRLIYAVSPTGEVCERNVVPDIIIHKRRTNNNLLAIEIKKSTNREDSFKDLSKLTAFRDQLGYQNSLFIRFLTKVREPRIIELEWK